MTLQAINDESDVFVLGAADPECRDQWEMLNCAVDPPSGIAGNQELSKKVVAFFEKNKADKGDHLLVILDEYPKYVAEIKKKVAAANEFTTNVSTFKEAVVHVIAQPTVPATAPGVECSFATCLQDTQAAFNFLTQSGGFSSDVEWSFAEQYPDESEKLKESKKADLPADNPLNTCISL